MSEVSHLNINGTTYDIKDEKARKLKTYTLVVPSNASADMKAIADYVCNSGNNETTINQAIAARKNGGEVVLAPGVYSLSDSINIDKGIVFRGMNSLTYGGNTPASGSARLCYSGSGVGIQVKANNVTLCDFEISGNTDGNAWNNRLGCGIKLLGSNIIVSNVLIGQESTGIEIEGSLSNDIIVCKCYFVDYHKGVNFITTNDDGGCRITENVFIPDSYWGVGDGMICNNHNSSNVIENNTCPIKDNKSTITVAAYNSSNMDKVNVDFVCDGKTDHTVISNAIAALPASGGKVVLLPGTYLLGSSINTYVSKSVWIQGCGAGTKLCGAAYINALFASPKSTRAEGTILRASDFTVCNNESKIRNLIEDFSGTGYKTADFENIIFRSNYTIPSGFGYTAATYNYTSNFCQTTFFSPYGFGSDFEDPVTYRNCTLITDYGFTYTLNNVIIRNMVVIGSKNPSSTQTFNVYNSDIEVRSPLYRTKLIINAKGSTRVAKSIGTTVNNSSGTNIIY